MNDLKNGLLHTRPKSWLPAFLFVLTGYVSKPQTDTSPFTLTRDLMLLFLIYSVFLWGGTSAFNSSQDHDEGPLNFLENPPPKPRFLGPFGLAWMAIAVVISFFINHIVLICSIASFILSVLYSYKIPFLQRRGKEIGGIDLLINSLGCGVIAIYMGWGIGSAPTNIITILLSLGFTFTVAGSYPATQIFQLSTKDTYESAKNFSTLLGPARALRVGVVFFCIGLFFLSLALFIQFKNSIPSTQALVGYGLFYLLFIKAALFAWQWAYTPFETPKARFKKLLFYLLTARLFWIFSGWSLHLV